MLGHAQEQPSIHQIEWEKHRMLKKTAAPADVYDPSIIALNKQRATGKLSRDVFGFLPDWEYPSAMSNLRFDLLTHIATFDFHVKPDGSIQNPSKWPWTDLINKSHENGVKVILTAVNFDDAEIHNVITDPTAKANFIQNAIDKMQLYKLDGINIDFEGLFAADRAAVINGFMAELTQTVHDSIPGSEVSFAGPAINWSDRWDLKGLAESCDYIFIMGYAFSGSWSSKSGSTAPLINSGISITQSVTEEYGAVVATMPEKVILGVPYYGNGFRTSSNVVHAPVVSYVGSVFYRSAVNNFKNYGTNWDDETASPWYQYADGNEWVQVWCDNARSIDEKFDLADNNNLRGVGMWALNYDGNKNDFWRVIQNHYSPTTPTPEEPLNLLAMGENDSTIRITFTPDVVADGHWGFISQNGTDFTDSIYTTNDTLRFSGLDKNALYHIYLKAKNSSGKSNRTSYLSATANAKSEQTVLIVDGFDRTSNNNRTFATRHAVSINQAGYSVATASNEAVEEDVKLLLNYNYVDWMLGDESTLDFTFTILEQNAVKKYLKFGGNLIVSGSEIGWDLSKKGTDADKVFYRDILKAEYIADAPNNNSGTFYSGLGAAGTPFASTGTFNFDDGSHGTYDVDWPDAIKPVGGAKLAFEFKNVPTSAGGAGIYYEGMFDNSDSTARLVHLSIPLETVYPETKRNNLFAGILNYFEQPLKVKDILVKAPKTYHLLPNFPNPFNPQTTIRFRAGQQGQYRVSIYNMAGQRIFISNQLNSTVGLNSWVWKGQNSLGAQSASGNYIYRIKIDHNNGSGKLLTGKMTLVR